MGKSIYGLLLLFICSSTLFGQVTKVLSLNGSTDYVQVPKLSDNATNTVTIEGWIKPSGAQAAWSGIYVCRAASYTTYGMMLRENNELGYMWEDTNGQRWEWSSKLSVPANQWSHVALVITPTNAILYLNGISATHAKACSPIVLNTANIGYDNQAVGRKFKGLISNFRVWNVSRTAAELASNTSTQLAPETAGLLADYRFSSETSNDFSINNKNASLNGGEFVTSEDTFETALLLNGSSDFGVLPRFFSADPSTFTIEWWLNPASTDKRHSLSGGGTGYGWGAFWFVVNANGSAQVGTNLDGSYLGDLIPAGTIEFNKWQHLTFSLSGGVGKFYKNGMLIASKTGISTPKSFTKLDLGYVGSGADYYIKGMLDDIKIWSSERSGEEITADMYSKQAPHTDLKGYWNFNSKTPAVLADSSGNGLDGTLTGGNYIGYMRPKFYIRCDSILQEASPITKISKGSNDQLLEKINVYITNSGTSLKAQSLVIDLEGTTNTSDISKLNLYYANGIVGGFSLNNKVASIIPTSKRITLPLNNMSVTQNGTFWLTADVSATAETGNELKSTCKKLNFSGLTAIPKDTMATATQALTILSSTAYSPAEKTSGTLHNPGQGLSIYIDGYSGIFSNKRPKYDNGLRYPELFWNYVDSIGASEKLNVLYIRLPWSEFEPTEGQYIWNNDPKYQALVQGARDRNLRLAFRVYFDSGDSYQQATPNFVKTAGAKGYTSNPSAWGPNGEAITAWNPYNNDVVFLQKVHNFINAFGAKYNDPSVVDYIDANGMALWGEGNGVSFDSSQPNANRDWVFRTIANYYRVAFPNVLLGLQNSSENDAVTVSITRQITDIYRRDSFGATQWLSVPNKVFYANEVANGIPVFAENAWNAFNPIVNPEYIGRWGFDSPESMIKASYRDFKASRANTADLRIPSDAVLWMKTNLVDSLVNNMGYRFVPSNLYVENSISENGTLRFYSTWTNTGWGCFPNGRPAWKNKYKLAFALLDQSDAVVKTFVSKADLSELLKGELYHYQVDGSVDDLTGGTYKLAFAIVDSMKQYTPGIQLAINAEPTSTGWYSFGEIQIPTVIDGLIQLKDKKDKITCSPQPTKGALNVRSEVPFNSIKMMDLNGKLVYQQHLNNAILSHHFDIQSFASGTYLLFVEGLDTKTYSTKVIKQ